MTDSKKLVEVEKSADSDAPVQIQPEKVATTANLGALADEVRPLDLTTRLLLVNMRQSSAVQNLLMKTRNNGRLSFSVRLMKILLKTF